MRRIVFLLVLLAGIGGGAFYWTREGASRAASDASYRTVAASRGSIMASVNATGTVTPTSTVIVGSQLSGQVIEILADFNSEVTKDQMVARLNTDQLRARLDAAKADLAQARAAKSVQESQVEKVTAEIERARAILTDMQAQLSRTETLLGDAQQTLDRQDTLRRQGIASGVQLQNAQTQRDSQRSSRRSAEAQTGSATAQIASLSADLKVVISQGLSAEAVILQKQAVVRQIEVDVANSEIRTPVGGVVVQRNIELGQMVAASLQAPTLFLVAEDLRKIEIYANVDESDVGRVAQGQTVSFTVNAYPGRAFEGIVKQVRLGSQTVQNVVIYTTVIAVDNPRLELRPGMTATARIQTERRDNALRVPNAAIRWRPPAAPGVSAPEPAAAFPGASAAPPAAGPASGADSPSGPFARPGGGNRGGQPGGGGQGGALQALERLATQLNLDKGQREGMMQILAGQRSSYQQLAAMAPPERRARAQQLRQEFRDRLFPALSEEQRQKYEQLADGAGRQQQGLPARVHVLGEDNAPKPLDIRIGATDGAFTEVLSNNLDEAMRLITSGGPKAAAPAGFFPRFGF